MKALVFCFIFLIIFLKIADSRILRVGPNEAFKNPIAVENIVTSGDTIWVLEGTYNVPKLIPKPGVSYISGDGHWKATLVGTSASVFAFGGGDFHTLIEGFEITKSNENTIHIVGGSNITIKNCYVHHAGPDGDNIKVSSGAHHITINGCVIHSPGQRASEAGDWQEPIDFFGCHDCTVKNSWLFHTHPDSGSRLVNCKNGSYNMIWENCIFGPHAANSAWTSVMRFGSDNDGSWTWSVRDMVVRNSIIFGCHTAAVGFWGVSRGYFYNNILFNNECAPLMLVQSGSSAYRYSDSIFVFNNIFMDDRGKLTEVFLGSSSLLKNLIHGNNLYWNNGSAAKNSHLHPDTDPGSATGDPLLRAPRAYSVRDVKPGIIAEIHSAFAINSPNSPAIDKGNDNALNSPFPGVAYDALGTLREAGKIDIGLAEFISIQSVKRLNGTRQVMTRVFPNPFSGQVMFVLRESFVVCRNPAVKIFSIDGTLVRQISSLDTRYEARRTIHWDGKDNNGITVNPGKYIYKLTENGKTVSRGSLLFRH
ncbi:MAG: right-handed parallel beta-helix repeat-containing protein [bacterium]